MLNRYGLFDPLQESDERVRRLERRHKTGNITDEQMARAYERAGRQQDAHRLHGRRVASALQTHLADKSDEPWKSGSRLKNLARETGHHIADHVKAEHLPSHKGSDVVGFLNHHGRHLMWRAHNWRMHPSDNDEGGGGHFDFGGKDPKESSGHAQRWARAWKRMIPHAETQVHEHPRGGHRLIVRWQNPEN